MAAVLLHVVAAAALAGGGTYSNTGADDCTNSIPVPVEVGPVGSPVTTTISGNNTGATTSPCAGIVGATWWERFELSEDARVRLDLCGTNPVHAPNAASVVANCTSTSCSNVFSGDSSSCPDGNIIVDFDVLPAGTYYYSIRGLLVEGPYIMHIAAEALPPLREGPDIITGHIAEVEQLGRAGPIGSGRVAFGVTSGDCNVGNVNVLVEPLPSIRHRLIEANLYRLSAVSGATRLEQIGQSWLKHTFAGNEENLCGYGCRSEAPGGPFDYKPGCADTYVTIQFTPCALGPRSAVHPFTAAMPGGASLGPGGSCHNNYPANNHIGHSHVIGDPFGYDGVEHRLQVLDQDLTPALNPGAQYFVEVAYLTPDEFLFHNGNQNNNVSHREFSVSGPDGEGVFTLTPLHSTVTESPAIDAWLGATQRLIEPYPLSDGRAFLAYQVTDLGNGTWHYEYMIYNMNLDASVGSLRIPIPVNAHVENIGFHAPLAHAPEANAENYATDPWPAERVGPNLTFAAEPYGVDPLANAIRYGTSYNFRYDADSPPMAATANVGIFKTGASFTVPILAPSAPVPAASAWSLLSLALLTLVAGTLVLRPK